MWYGGGQFFQVGGWPGLEAGLTWRCFQIKNGWGPSFKSQMFSNKEWVGH